MVEPGERARSRSWSLVWRVAGLLLGIASLYLALRNVRLADIGLVLRQANPWWLILALGSVGLNTLAKAVRWKVLVGAPGKDISTGDYLVSLLVGQMLNTMLPARLGEVSRVHVIGTKGPGRSYVLGTVMMEKVLDMLAYAVLFLALLLLLPLPLWVQESGFTFAAVAAAATGMLLLLTYQERRIEGLVRWGIHRLPARIATYLLPRLESAFRSLVVLQNRGGLARLAVWTTLIWLTAVWNNYLVLRSLDIALPLPAALLVLIGLQAGISLPSVPGRLGIFEYICVLALGSFGVAQPLAFSYGLLLHFIVLVPTTLIGVIFFIRLGPQRQRLIRTETLDERR